MRLLQFSYTKYTFLTHFSYFLFIFCFFPQEFSTIVFFSTLLIFSKAFIASMSKMEFYPAQEQKQNYSLPKCPKTLALPPIRISQAWSCIGTCHPSQGNDHKDNLQLKWQLNPNSFGQRQGVVTSWWSRWLRMNFTLESFHEWFCYQ